MRWEAWPALLATLAWALFLGALLATSAPGLALEWAALLIIAGVPLAVSFGTLVADWRRAEWSGPSPREPGPRLTHLLPAWRRRLAFAVALALLLGAVGADLLNRPSSFDVRWFDGDLPLMVTHLVPGTGEAWAYLIALGLTFAVASGSSRPPTQRLLVSAGSLVAGALAGAVLLVAAGGARLDAASVSGRSTDCQRPAIGVGVPPHFEGAVVSHAEGQLDGQSLGTADLRSSPAGVDAGVTAAFDGAWGGGTREFDGSSTTISALDPFRLADMSLWLFGSAKTILADDLGMDLVGGVPLRRCSIVIDGRSAMFGFAALRWLTGAHVNPGARLGVAPAAIVEPGAGLEAWRGTVDYWIQPRDVSANGDLGYRGLGLVAVTIDGQPQDWPVTGLRATLHAWIWFPPTTP